MCVKVTKSSKTVALHTTRSQISHDTVPTARMREMIAPCSVTILLYTGQ